MIAHHCQAVCIHSHIHFVCVLTGTTASGLPWFVTVVVLYSVLVWYSELVLLMGMYMCL